MTTIPLKQAKGWAPERRVRQRRDFAAVEERRTPAADLFEQGVRPAEIARQLGVPSDCLGLAERVAAVRQGRTAGRAGRLPKLFWTQLSPEQLTQVESALIQGTGANGYPNEALCRMPAMPRLTWDKEACIGCSDLTNS